MEINQQETFYLSTKVQYFMKNHMPTHIC